MRAFLIALPASPPTLLQPYWPSGCSWRAAGAPGMLQPLGPLWLQFPLPGMPFPRQLYGSVPPVLRIFTRISPCWWGWLAVVFLSKISISLCPLQYLSAFPLFFFLPMPYTGSFAYYYIKFFFLPQTLSSMRAGTCVCLVSCHIPHRAWHVGAQ